LRPSPWGRSSLSPGSPFRSSALLLAARFQPARKKGAACQIMCPKGCVNIMSYQEITKVKNKKLVFDLRGSFSSPIRILWHKIEKVFIWQPTTWITCLYFLVFTLPKR
jgi:hypothetical protein